MGKTFTLGQYPNIGISSSGTPTTNYLPKFTGASTIGNSQIFDSGSFVGINNTTPQSMLDVYIGSVGTYFRGGSDNVARQLKISSSTTTNAGDTHTFDAQSGTGVLAFATTSTERMRISSGGEVQIYSRSLAVTRNTSNEIGVWVKGIGTHSTGYASIQSFASDVTYDTKLVLQENGGKVLIGTTTSNNTPLEIECGGGGDGIYLKRSAAYCQMFIGGTTTGTAITFIRTAGSGGVKLDSGATAWASASDERLKNISNPIENAVEKLTTLRAVNFSWKTDEEGKNNLGLIAQDIQKVFPEVVSVDEERDEYGVRYTELIPVLVAAIQELSAKVTALENK